MSFCDSLQIKKALRGLKVEVTHRGNMRRKYRITDITKQAIEDLQYAFLSGLMMSFVVDSLFCWVLQLGCEPGNPCAITCPSTLYADSLLMTRAL